MQFRLLFLQHNNKENNNQQVFSHFLEQVEGCHIIQNPILKLIFVLDIWHVYFSALQYTQVILYFIVTCVSALLNRYTIVQY